VNKSRDHDFIFQGRVVTQTVLSGLAMHHTVANFL